MKNIKEKDERKAEHHKGVKNFWQCHLKTKKINFLQELNSQKQQPEFAFFFCLYLKKWFEVKKRD